MTTSLGRPAAELTQISPEGALAGRAFAIVLAVSAAGLVVASWGDLWLRCGQVAGPCVMRSAGAVLVDLLSLFGVAWSVVIMLRIRRRPVDRDGSSRYVWCIGVLFSLGLVLIAARIPAFTCARGRFDEVLELCMHPPGTSAPAHWLLAKDALVVVGLVGGVAIAARPRWVRFTISAAALAWGVGVGWSAADAFVR